MHDRLIKYCVAVNLLVLLVSTASARWMDPESGRFLSRDSIGDWGDPANSGNGYAYCNNNPWSKRDPYGLGPLGSGSDGTAVMMYQPSVGDPIPYSGTADDSETPYDSNSLENMQCWLFGQVIKTGDDACAGWLGYDQDGNMLSPGQRASAFAKDGARLACGYIGMGGTVPVVRPATAVSSFATKVVTKLRGASTARIVTNTTKGYVRLPGVGEPVAVPNGAIPPKTITNPSHLLPGPKFQARDPFHHIFPQRADLSREFQRVGIDPHDFTMQIPKQLHQQIHSGGPRGGAWNKAWTDFFRSNPGATAQDVYKEAGRLIHEFQLPGSPVIPYPR